jgi:preprotein translocase subunit SecA
MNITNLNKQDKHKKYWRLVKKINALDEAMQQLSDNDLKQKTTEFKDRLKNGEKIEDLIVEAFAVVREASYRVIGLKHFDVQLLAGISLFEGNISEMPTGEGKTLVASCPTYLRALEGHGVHVITVNEYLARRDQALIGQIHNFLGLTVGLNVPGMENEEKKEAYQSDITYGVGTEFGFDYLRDNLVYNPNQKVQRPYYYAIIDEIDSVLIDEARTPLIIAGKTQNSKGLYGICAKVAKNLKLNEHYTFDEELKLVALTDEGINYIEKVFAVDNLYDYDHRILNHFMMQAVRAKVIFNKDVDYIVDEGLIKLVDMNTGRIMDGRSLSDGLHQALEAKEGLSITEENKVQATVTIQNYYQMYPILSGMTGTAKTEETEFQTIYGMDVKVIPTNKPIIREDLEDQLYLTKEAKYDRIVEEVKASHQNGRPVLIGTTSILQSEDVAKRLDEHNLPYELLNAKSVEQEARLIALAGQMHQITIATNMAGRGTDIVLGEGVKALGGLHVIGTEKHDSRRIDNQLKGRSGRQGDPGLSQFIVSLEDDLFIRYARDDVEKYAPKFKTEANGLVNNKQAKKFIDRTQKIAEGIHYQMREFNMKLDGVFFDQQRVIYEFRNELLFKEDALTYVLNQLDDLAVTLVDNYLDDPYLEEDKQEKTDKLLHRLSEYLLVDIDSDIFTQGRDDIRRAVQAYQEEHNKQAEAIPFNEEQILRIRQFAMMTIDRYWIRHLDDLTRKKEGSSLRQYEQEDHTQIFKRETYQLFTEMFTLLKLELGIQYKKLAQAALEKDKGDQA